MKNHLYQKIHPPPMAASNAQKKPRADLGGRWNSHKSPLGETYAFVSVVSDPHTKVQVWAQLDPMWPESAATLPPLDHS